MHKTNCPITNSLKLIGGKWKIAIIYNLMKGPKRFGELKKVLSPITQQMLTKQLRELEISWTYLLAKVVFISEATLSLIC